jgi:hypothetical protein
MIATVDIAECGFRHTVSAMRRRPTPEQVPGLRWLDIAFAAPLATSRPPRLRRAVMIALWDGAEDAARFTDSHPTAAQFATGVHATLRPLRAFGAWPGVGDEIPRSRLTPAHDGAVVVVTLGRLRVSQAIRFLRASRPAERAAVEADGFIWGTASARPPFVATVSLWESADAAASYAYAPPDAGHPRAISQQRRKDFHHQSAFIRFAPIEIRGTLAHPNPLVTE